jgi:hypothetical protein
MVRGGLTEVFTFGAEMGVRRLSLLVSRPEWVQPRGRSSGVSPDGLLILQRGDNPSTDYYLRPRLPRDLPCEVLDLSADPRRSQTLRGARAPWVVICRYINESWLRALEAARPARVSFFADDDLPALLRDRSVPKSARGKVAAHYGRHVRRLSALASDVWLSTPALAASHPSARVSVLPPVPESDYPAPAGAGPLRVVYHGTDSHAEERRFAVEAARRLSALAPEVAIEITGDAATRRQARDLAGVNIVEQTAWPDYLHEQRGRGATVFMAPLTRSRLNDGRAPVKVFDAARLGAVGVFADHPVYRSWVRPEVDGVLAEMTPDGFAEAVAALLRDEPRRLRLAAAARDRLAEVRRTTQAFPEPVA